jgi:hypothetical protein
MFVFCENVQKDKNNAEKIWDYISIFFYFCRPFKTTLINQCNYL